MNLIENQHPKINEEGGREGGERGGGGGKGLVGGKEGTRYWKEVTQHGSDITGVQ